MLVSGTRVQSNSQLCHCGRDSAAKREAGEDEPGKQEDGESAEVVRELGEADGTSWENIVSINKQMFP